MHGGIKRNECDMELLMTPAEVVEAAFGGGDVIDAAIVTESAVLTAQRRYLRPVFGVSFYGALEQGRYGAFLAACARPVRQVPRAARCGCPARQARHRAFRRRIFRADGRCRTEASAGTSTCRGRDIVDCRRRTAGGGSCGVSRIRPAREYKTAALRGRGRGALTGRFGRVRMTRRGVPSGTPLVYL